VGRAGEATDRAVVGDGERGGEQGVSGVDADLHGLLGADELEQHVEELPLVRRRGHQVPAAQAAQSASSLRPDPRRTGEDAPRGKEKKHAYHGCLAVTSLSSFMLSGSRGYTLVSRMYCARAHQKLIPQSESDQIQGTRGVQRPRTW
jgi:hypothetical protein